MIVHKNTSTELLQIVDVLKQYKRKFIVNYEDIIDITLKSYIKKVDGFKIDNQDIYNLALNYIEDQKRVLLFLEQSIKEKI